MMNEKACNFKGSAYIIYGLIFVPVLAYFLSLFLTAVNIPLQDEYDAVLNFANKFFSSGSNRLALLFSQHNEHRLMLYRSLTVLITWLTGSLNLKVLTIIGNLSLLGFAVFLYKSARLRLAKHKALYFLPAAFMLFQPQYYAIILQSGAIADLGIVCFSLAAIYFLNKPAIRYFFFALFAAMLAVFSKANGFLIFPAGLVILIFNKKYKEGLIWSLTGVILSVIYFAGYVRPVDSPPLAIFNQPVESGKFILYLIGAGLADFFPSSAAFSGPLTMISGALVLMYFIFIFTRLKSGKLNIIIFTFLVFLFLTVIAITIGRSLFGAEYALSSRFRVYSDIFLILVYITIIEFLSDKVIKLAFPAVLILAMVFNFISYKKNYPAMLYTRQVLENGLAEWKIDNTFGLQYPNPGRANAIMQEAIQKGIYSPPF